MPHTKNKKEIQSNFSNALSDALTSRYGVIVSATRLADEFNLRASGTTTISRQTALKWIKGTTLPDAGRMKVLAEWLDLDLNDIFKTNQC
jgi:hypothetical protein